MIFRRLKATGADWLYHFPEVYLTDITALKRKDETAETYSVSKAAVAELEAQKRRAEIERMRAKLRQANAEAREQSLDREPPATVRAYRQVCGRDPRGWPPG